LPVSLSITAAILFSIVKALCLFFIRTLLTQRFHFVRKLGDDCMQIPHGRDLFTDWRRQFAGLPEQRVRTVTYFESLDMEVMKSTL